MEKIMGTLNIGLFMSPVDKKKRKRKKKRRGDLVGASNACTYEILNYLMQSKGRRE